MRSINKPAFPFAFLRAAILGRRPEQSCRARPVPKKFPPLFFRAKGASGNACLFLISSLFFVFAMPLQAEDVAQRMDGTVTSVDAAKRIVTIEYIHPVTEEKTKKEFRVKPDAGMHQLKKLEDLRPGDLLTVDFYERGREAEAVYLTRIELERSYVSRAELAEALTKIGKTRK